MHSKIDICFFVYRPHFFLIATFTEPIRKTTEKNVILGKSYLFMWKSMRRNIWVIAGLTVVNIAIMKYNDIRYQSREKVSTWITADATKPVTDSLPRP